MTVIYLATRTTDFFQAKQHHFDASKNPVRSKITLLITITRYVHTRMKHEFDETIFHQQFRHKAAAAACGWCASFLKLNPSKFHSGYSYKSDLA